VEKCLIAAGTANLLEIARSGGFFGDAATFILGLA
jgi:hypothetical protein